MNETINLLQNHSSVRKFKNKPLTDEQVNHIFKSANQASSFSLLQAVSIIRITDEDTRKSYNGIKWPSKLYSRSF